MNKGRLFDLLKSDQSSFALQALQSPGDKTEYEFGYRVGYVAGVQRAVELLLLTLKDEEENGKPL